MKLSMWYHSSVKNPTSSGYHLALKDFQLGGDHADVGYFYYCRRENRWYTANQVHDAKVVYWTDANPLEWLQVPEPRENSNPALELAQERVLQAVEKYNLLESLTD